MKNYFFCLWSAIIGKKIYPSFENKNGYIDPNATVEGIDNKIKEVTLIVNNALIGTSVKEAEQVLFAVISNIRASTLIVE